MRKLFTYFIALFIAIVPVYAEGNEGDATTYGVGCNASTAYIQSTKNLGTTIDTTVTAKNSTATAQVISYTTQRTVMYTGNVSAKADRDVIVKKIGLSFEIGYGVTTTTGYTVSTNVPAYTTYYCDIGSSTVYSSGTLKYTYDDCSTSQKTAYLNYTYGPYAHWHK